MSETQPAATTGPATSDLGVVDPIQVPGVDAVRQLWSRLPRLGQLFVALVVVDVVVRALGLFQTSLFIELTAPLTWLTAFLPHDALILLPAVILARRPGAPTELPLLLRGAVAVALVELLEDPVRGLALGTGAGDDLFTLVLLAGTGAVVTGLGWVAIATDLRRFVPAKPWDSIALASNLVGGALAIAAAIAAVSAFFLPNLDLGTDLMTLLVRLANAVVAVSGLGLAYLAWVVIRGTDDPSRSATATRLASVSVAGVAIGTVLSLVAGSGAIWLVVFVVTYVGGFTGLVVAFGLGLADASGTIDRAVPTDDRSPEPPEPA